jgi:hypothetical protein
MSEYTCPHCGKAIHDDEALLCLYCGENLERSIGVLGGLKYPTPRIIMTSIVVLVLSSFVLWIIVW